MSNSTADNTLKNEISDPGKMFAYSVIASGVALLIGSLLDNMAKWLQQGRTDRINSTLFFCVQLLANILLMVVVSQKYKKFLPWMQLTVSGLMFSVLMFAVQDNLLKNASRITTFENELKK